MYLVYCDGIKIYDLFEDLTLIDPVLELEMNSPGTFTFTMLPDHPYYDLPQRLTSRITVYRDDDELFVGRVIEEETNFYNEKTLTCEGELAFLNDSIQRPAEYHDISVRDYFKTLIEQHNEQVEEDKRFEIGIVTISDDNDSIFRYTNYNTTMTEMKEDLVDDFGGYIRVRNYEGHRYLDYIKEEDYGVMNEQPVRFGVNLLDYSENMDSTDIATVIIPLGEQLEESPIEALNMRLTVESVNKGSDAIESEEAVETFGRIVKTVIWDDVTVASNLLEKGKNYLTDYQWDNMVLDVGAVDLNDSGVNVEHFNLGDQIRVISSPHGLDRYFTLSAMTIHLDDLSQNSYTLGTEISNKSLSASIKSTYSQIDRVESEITPTQVILNQAKEQATNLINAATHGYVIVEPDEILIMNTDDKETATKVWRWNINGLGYSSTGYNGTFGLAMTMDGAIVADYITTGTLTADIIKAGTIQDLKKNSYWDLNTGHLVINGDQFSLDSSGNFILNTKQFTLDSSGNASFAGNLSSPTGTIGGWYIGSNSFYNGTSSITSNTEGMYIGTDGFRNVYNATSSDREYVQIRYGHIVNVYAPYNWECDIEGDIVIQQTSGTRYTATLTPQYIWLSRGSEGAWFEASNTDRTLYIADTSNREYEISGNYFYGYQNIYSSSTYWFRISNSAASIYANGSYLSGSDRTLKTDIEPLSSNNYDSFFDRLKPKTYRLKDSDEIHTGFVYQDVVEELEEAGLDPEESALVEEVEVNEETHETVGAIAYNEIIALLVHEVQNLKTEVKELKAQLT